MMEGCTSLIISHRQVVTGQSPLRFICATGLFGHIDSLLLRLGLQPKMRKRTTDTRLGLVWWLVSFPTRSNGGARHEAPILEAMGLLLSADLRLHIAVEEIVSREESDDCKCSYKVNDV